ncbi:MAG TPA: copper oxidase, partial [Burkholderiaceae bacterium]|nr:copper oxidase [Burkholderiaceae bacterium]
PDYMVMGERGMADMGEMQMPIPDQTLPMMTGTGPFGAIEMGGMFSMLKVRKDQKPGDYSDPGWYQQPTGTQSFEWNGSLPEPARFKSEMAAGNGPVHGLRNRASESAQPAKTTTLTVRKPGVGMHNAH